MAKTVYATFLGGADDAGEEPKSFLDVVQGLELDGPPDLSPRCTDPCTEMTATGANHFAENSNAGL
jgi:hypothetical protein